MIYNEKVCRIEVPMKMGLHNLLLGQYQIVKLMSDLKFEVGQKIEIVKRSESSFHIYPVVVLAVDTFELPILVEADYSLDINRIGEMLAMTTFSRRKGWKDPEEFIALFSEGDKRIILNSKSGGKWEPKGKDFNNDWAVIRYCVDELS